MVLGFIFLVFTDFLYFRGDGGGACQFSFQVKVRSTFGTSLFKQVAVTPSLPPRDRRRQRPCLPSLQPRSPQRPLQTELSRPGLEPRLQRARPGSDGPPPARLPAPGPPPRTGPAPDPAAPHAPGGARRTGGRGAAGGEVASPGREAGGGPAAGRRPTGRAGKSAASSRRPAPAPAALTMLSAMAAAPVSGLEPRAAAACRPAGLEAPASAPAPAPASRRRRHRRSSFAAGRHRRATSGASPNALRRPRSPETEFRPSNGRACAGGAAPSPRWGEGEGEGEGGRGAASGVPRRRRKGRPSVGDPRSFPKFRARQEGPRRNKRKRPNLARRPSLPGYNRGRSAPGACGSAAGGDVVPGRAPRTVALCERREGASATLARRTAGFEQRLGAGLRARMAALRRPPRARLRAAAPGIPARLCASCRPLRVSTGVPAFVPPQALQFRSRPCP